MKKEAPYIIAGLFLTFAFLLLVTFVSGCGSIQSPSPNPTVQLSVSSDFPEAVRGYDSLLIEAIAAKWDNLKHEQKFRIDRSGKVVIKFCLHSDGRVSDLKVIDSNVGPLLAYLCREAVLDSTPYPHFPESMVEAIKGNSRDVTFTFWYP